MFNAMFTTMFYDFDGIFKTTAWNG